MQEARKRHEWITVLVIMAGIAAAGFVALWYTTRLGVGMANDAQDYVSTARSIAAGRGALVFNPDPSDEREWVPLTVFPPLYPAALALSARIMGTDVIPAARYLQSMLLAINAVLAAGLAYVCARSLPAALALGCLAISMLLNIHSHGLSEGLFISFTLAGLWATGECLRQSHPARDWIFLLLGAVCVSAALTTRYAGASVLIACIVALLTLARQTISRRLIHVLVFSAIAILPLMLWTRHIGSIGQATGRELLFHPPDLIKLEGGLQTMGTWLGMTFFPRHRALIGGIVVLGLLCLLGWTLIRRDLRERIWNDSVLRMLLIFVVIYPPFLILSISFFDALTALNGRILSPMLIPLLVVIVAAILRALAQAARGTRCLAIACLWVFVGVWSFVEIRVANAARRDGLDYTTRQWRASAIRKQALELPADAVLYSNAWNVLYLTGERRSYSLPVIVKRKSDQPVARDKISILMKQMENHLGNNGYIVYFDSIDTSSFLATPEMIGQWMPLELVASFGAKGNPTSAGRIYRLTNSRATSIPANSMSR